MAAPRVRCGVLLRRSIDTVHSKRIFGFCYESLIFVHRLFRNPNKLLMGVQIKMKLSEKCTVPCRLGEASRSITKSGKFAFDEVRVKTTT